MYSKYILKLLKHLAKNRSPKLANKILHSLKSGKPLDLTKSELSDFNIIRHDLLKGEARTRITPEFSVRQGIFYNKEGGVKGGGSLSRSYFGTHEKVPNIDIDLKDIKSHAPDQVVHATAKDFLPSLIDFMKTPGGRKSALKMYRTPGGLRIFDVSKAHRGTSPNVWEGVMHDLGADRRFIQHSKNRGNWNTRLFPKPGREHNIWDKPGNYDPRYPEFTKQNPGDFVAKQTRPGKVIVGKDAEVDLDSWREVFYHDELIKNIVNRKKSKGTIKATNLLDLASY